MGAYLPWFGALACLGYAGHAVHYLRAGDLAQMLWICHVSALVSGIGLIARSPLVNATGLMGLAIGFPSWLLYLYGGGEFIPTSLLTHVLGFAVGVAGASALGLPRRTWLAALTYVAVLMLVSRLLTEPESNINLAFGPDPDLGLWEVGGAAHWALQLGQWGLGFGALQLVLTRVFGPPRQADSVRSE